MCGARNAGGNDHNIISNPGAVLAGTLDSTRMIPDSPAPQRHFFRFDFARELTGVRDRHPECARGTDVSQPRLFRASWRQLPGRGLLNSLQDTNCTHGTSECLPCMITGTDLLLIPGCLSRE
jgi:hypothetical protein